MPSPNETMFNEAMTAINTGDRARARDLLTRLLKNVPDHADYWVWMSAVVETSKERVYCLKEALKLDPQNVSARRGLAMLGAIPPDESLALPARFQKRSWQIKLPTDMEETAVKGPPVFQLVGMGVAAVVVVGLLIYAFTTASQRLFQRSQAVRYVDLPTSTAVLGVETAAPTATRPAVSGSPTPLWMLLKATYTPTPLYVNTPHTSEAYRIGLRAFQAGDWAKAETYFIQVATAEPGSTDILYYLGEAARRAGDNGTAIDWYNQAIEMNASFAPSYVGRARARLAANAKAVKEALADLETAAELSPEYGEAYLGLAELHLISNQPQDALDALEQAAVLLPDSPLVYLYRAEANLKLDRTDEALADAQRANELDITLLPAYRMIGEVLQAQGDYPGALKMLSTYVNYEPEDAEAWVWIAKAYLESGKADDGLKALDRALRLNANQMEARLIRAGLLLEKGRAEDALKDYETILRVDKESFTAMMGAGQALMELNYPGDAYKQFESAKGLAVTDLQKAEWLFWRARSLEALKGYEDVALRDYKSLLELPKDSVKPEWAEYARKRIALLVTSTPTPRKATATPTVTVTRKPTITPTVTTTRKPTITATATKKP